MSKVLDKATAHFRNRISGAMKKITVPEWDCDIYYKEASSLKEEGKILELNQQGKTVEALVESLVVKARNEDGTKMFAMPDKMILMNEVDPSVLIRVISEINNVNMEDFDAGQAEKN
jgi:hypothetical protein